MLLTGEPAARGQPCRGTRGALRRHRATTIPPLRRFGRDTAGALVRMVTRGPPPAAPQDPFDLFLPNKTARQLQRGRRLGWVPDPHLAPLCTPAAPRDGDRAPPDPSMVASSPCTQVSISPTPPALPWERAQVRHPWAQPCRGDAGDAAEPPQVFFFPLPLSFPPWRLHPTWGRRRSRELRPAPAMPCRAEPHRGHPAAAQSTGSIPRASPCP